MADIVAQVDAAAQAHRAERQVAQPELTVVAHNIRSMANVGALFRTCDGAGVSELILSGYTGTPPDRRIAKVALGAEQAIDWRSVGGVDELLGALAGMYVVVLEQAEEAVAMGALDIPSGRRVALVACEELFGADEQLLARADAVLELPMRGFKQSLNVAVAAGIAMYGIADRMWGTAETDMASRQQRPPVREGVLTMGVTCGETRDGHRERRGVQ